MANIQPVHSPCYCINYRRAANTLTKYYDAAFAPVGLTGNQFFLLNSIQQLGPCNKSELAQYTSLDRTTIIRNLNTLEKKALVEPAPGASRRSSAIQLSETGRNAFTSGLGIWQKLQEALKMQLHDCSINGLFTLSRAILCKSETEYDKFEVAFLDYFQDVIRYVEASGKDDISAQILDWVNNPGRNGARIIRKTAEDITDEMRSWRREDIEKKFRHRLKSQRSEHNGGYHYVGTHGISPFGNSGSNPNAIRVGGKPMSRSALRVAGQRTFQDFREDNVLSIRQFQMAFRRVDGTVQPALPGRQLFQPIQRFKDLFLPQLRRGVPLYQPHFGGAVCRLHPEQSGLLRSGLASDHFEAISLRRLAHPLPDAQGRAVWRLGADLCHHLRHVPPVSPDHTGAETGAETAAGEELTVGMESSSGSLAPGRLFC